MNAMKNLAASETPVMNGGLRVGPEQDSSSTLHFPLVMTADRRSERQGLEGQGRQGQR